MILDTPHGPLYYEITDTPPWVTSPQTVVFCHGVAINCDLWAGWLPVTAQHFRVVRFDTRGFGRSHVEGREFAWSLDLLADDILAVARAAGVERFHLVGESMGGTACLRLACREPDALLSLACASTPHRGAKIKRVGEWRNHATREGMQAWSKQMMDDRFYPGALPQPLWDWYYDVQTRTAVKPLLEAGDMLMRADLSAELPRIKVPTLLLAPDASPFLALDIPAEIHQLIAHSEVAVFPKSRHGLPFSHARECAETHLAFLRRHGFGSGAPSAL